MQQATNKASPRRARSSWRREHWPEDPQRRCRIPRLLQSKTVKTVAGQNIMREHSSSTSFRCHTPTTYLLTCVVCLLPTPNSVEADGNGYIVIAGRRGPSLPWVGRRPSGASLNLAELVSTTAVCGPASDKWATSRCQCFCAPSRRLFPDDLITYDRRARGWCPRAVACPFFLTFSDWTVSCKSDKTCRMSQNVVDRRHRYVLIRRVV